MLEKGEEDLWDELPGMLKAFSAPCVCWDRLMRIKYAQPHPELHVERSNQHMS
jgi:hypothetical protein